MRPAVAGPNTLEPLGLVEPERAVVATVDREPDAPHGGAAEVPDAGPKELPSEPTPLPIGQHADHPDLAVVGDNSVAAMNISKAEAHDLACRVLEDERVV